MFFYHFLAKVNGNDGIICPAIRTSLRTKLTACALAADKNSCLFAAWVGIQLFHCPCNRQRGGGKQAAEQNNIGIIAAQSIYKTLRSYIYPKVNHFKTFGAQQTDYNILANIVDIALPMGLGSPDSNGGVKRDRAC